MNTAGSHTAGDALAVTPAELPDPTLLGGGRRIWQMSLLGARHLTPALARRAVRRDSNPAHALRRTFESLGATYVKFGQFIASAPGIVGESIAHEFRGCLDTGPPVPFAYVRATIEAELGLARASVCHVRPRSAGGGIDRRRPCRHPGRGRTRRRQSLAQ